jgi:hypothetical protein
MRNRFEIRNELPGERAVFKASPMWEDEKVIVLHSMIE